MEQFVANVNLYLKQSKIKQTYLSRVSGIEKNKLSRILKGAQEITGSDMTRLAEGLGMPVRFFLEEPFVVPMTAETEQEHIAFYAGHPTKEQEKIAWQLIALLENVDEVLGAETRFANTYME